jgi:hypothetical protein
MTIQARQLGSPLLLILALAAALLAGLVAVQRATCHSNLTQTFVSAPGGDGGGGRIRWATVPGGDGRWHYSLIEPRALIMSSDSSKGQQFSNR